MRRPGPVIDRTKRPETRINERIRVREVRVIGPDGTQLGILSTDEARQQAADLGLDLVEVSPTSRPPVCKIMDYGKFKYTSKKKAVEQRKNQRTIEVKEVKLRPKTDSHDVQIKLNRARRFLEEGNKVKVTILFRGRELTHPEIGQKILERVAEDLTDIASVEFFPRMEGRTMFMILAGGKAPAKKEQKAPADKPQTGDAVESSQVTTQRIASAPMPTDVASDGAEV